MSYKIPLYSKSPEYSGLPEFYDFAKGCKIKIDKKQYYDFSVIGASACILGYADKYVNKQVIKCIKNGSFSSLNSRYMEKLTNLLLGMHQNYDTVRYCKGGGEALDLALMLAREKFECSNIVIYQVGYNGWKVKNTFYDYEKIIYHFENINKITTQSNRPDIIMFELIRHEFPKPEVINKLKEWQKQGTILIIDEVTTGFRFLCGGVHTLYNLEPDIIVYAKGTSNGYPMACLIGKNRIMESDLWISSTYWSDSIGFVASYYTIKKLKHCTYKLLVKLGKSVMKIWEVCAKKYKLKIKIGEVPNIASFEFLGHDSLYYKTLFIEEMQRQGILALDQFYPTFSHNAASIGAYAKACDKAFAFVKQNLTFPENKIINKLKVLNK